MRFLKFKLENYKGISKVEINLSKDSSTCLLGMNEAGKTTILEGINHIGWLCHGVNIGNGLRQRIKPAKDPFTGDIILSTTLVFEENEVDLIKPNEDASEEECAITNSVKEQVRKSKEIDINFQFPYVDGTPGQRQVSIRCKDAEQDLKRTEPVLLAVRQSAPQIILYEDVLFSAPEAIIFASKNLQETDPDGVRANGMLHSEQNAQWQEIFSDILTNGFGLKQNGKPWSFRDDYIEAIASEKIDLQTADRRLAEMNRQLNRVITTEWTGINGKKTFDRIAIAQMNPESVNTSNKAFDHAFNLTVYSNEVPFPLRDRSKGAQWYFCFKILTEIRASRLNKGVIFLLDEPAANLHPSNQSKLFQSLGKLSGREDVSLIYATHSVDMTGTSPEQIENTYLVINRIDEAKDANSSGKISAKCLANLEKKHFEEELYSQALLPLISKSILEDMSKQGAGKQGAMALVDGIKKYGLSALDNTHRILKIFEILS